MRYLFQKQILRRRSALLGLMLVCLSSTGCLRTQQEVPKGPEAVGIWWGNATEITEFLSSPLAQADRWVVQSVGQ